jgi:hypothetical protein
MSIKDPNPSVDIASLYLGTKHTRRLPRERKSLSSVMPAIIQDVEKIKRMQVTRNISVHASHYCQLQ